MIKIAQAIALSVVLLALGAIAGLSLLARAEPAQRLPLIHAGLSICAPIGPQGGEDAPAPQGPPAPTPSSSIA